MEEQEGPMWKYILAWIPMVPIAIANGAMREALFRKRLGELRAHQLSCATGILLFALYVWALVRIWPPASSGQALAIGIIWLALTVAFEFSFGHFARGLSWGELLSDYNILAGRLWVLVLLWVTVAPYIFYRLQR
jgi:lysylphosphatidylglycerol synthetase-like protein (DUF2156 family)